jgi:hypothetical protein
MLGGLPHLLSSLEQNFAFESPRADELEFSADDGRSLRRLPIWILTGHWKPEALQTLLGRDAKADKIPEQLPDKIEIVLGRDEVLPLFPYRVTYWRTPKLDTGGIDHGTSPAPQKLLSLELFKVSRQRNIAPSEFIYQPGTNQEVRDVTARYVQRLSTSTVTR